MRKLHTNMFTLLLLYILINNYSLSMTLAASSRPTQVISALESKGNLFYLGVASNMLRSKITNRGLNNTKIQFISIKPATVGNHRLAFNSKGFLPLEPAMGGLEPASGDVCHAALIEMTSDNYQKLWLSEGGGRPEPGYEEIVVNAFPYGSSTPVEAIALRATPKNRLPKDASPSQRYLNIIIEGAKETGLDSAYISKLASHPTQKPSLITQKLSAYYAVSVFLMTRLKTKLLYSFISKLLWKVYVPATAHPFSRLLSELVTLFFILPGSIVGITAKLFYSITGMKIPTMFGATASKAN